MLVNFKPPGIVGTMVEQEVRVTTSSHKHTEEATVSDTMTLKMSYDHQNRPSACGKREKTTLRWVKGQNHD